MAIPPSTKLLGILAMYVMKPETERYGRFVKGVAPWNKGKTGVYSEEILKRMSEAKKGKRMNPFGEFKKGHIPWNTGLNGVLKPNKTSFKKGRSLPEEIEKKRLNNLREKIIIKPNLEMNKDLAYILGILKGDGCVYKINNSYKVTLDITDKRIALSFMDALRKINLNPHMLEINPSNGIGKRKKYVVNACSIKFGSWYEQLNIKELRELLREKEEVIGFIKGFYESEGCISKSKSRVITDKKRYEYDTTTISISNTNLELINLLEYLINKLGIKFSLNGPYENNQSISKGLVKPIYRIRTSRKEGIHLFMKTINPIAKNLEGNFHG